MARVTFYLLDSETIDSQPAILLATCALAHEAAVRRQKLLVLCASKAQAEQLDSMMFALPGSHFIAHNLVGEGPKQGTNVQIGWPGAPLPKVPLLINLQAGIPSDTARVNQILDFVPVAPSEKQQARDRYKHYRAQGAQLRTEPGNALTEIFHG